jgi:hypothetical protein
MEIYCEKCRYLTNNDKCCCPSNLKVEYDIDWKSDNKTYIYIKNPKELNKDNNCQLFKEKITPSCTYWF